MMQMLEECLSMKQMLMTRICPFGKDQDKSGMRRFRMMTISGEKKKRKDLGGTV